MCFKKFFGGRNVYKEKTISAFARVLLFLTAVIWGGSFIIVKGAVDNIPPIFLVAIRFSISSVLLGLIFIKHFKNFTADYLWRGAIIGACLFGAYAIQTAGIQLTTAGKNAFLSCLYSVLVPFMLWAFKGKRPDRYNIVAALTCAVGAGLVILGTVTESINIGDLISLVASFFYAAHFVAVEKLSKNKDIIIITILQFVYAAVYSWALTLLTEEGTFVGIEWGGVLYLAIACTTLGFLMQNIGQKLTSSSSASLILSLESVFGVLFSIIFGYEELKPQATVGFVLIFIAVIISETKLSFLRKKRQTNQKNT